MIPRVSDRPPTGFSFIELMVVMALIAVLAGALGLALRGGDRAVALQNGQATVASLLVAARGQAALSGRNAALVVHADPGDRDRFLRAFAIVVRNPENTGWTPSQGWLAAPAGVAVLPPVEIAGLSSPGQDWTDLRSSALSDATESVMGSPCHVLVFTPRGTVSGGGGDIVLAPALARPPDSSFPLFLDQPDAVRGVSVSTYGVATLIHDRTGF